MIPQDYSSVISEKDSLPIFSELEKINEENKTDTKDAQRQLDISNISQTKITPFEFLQIIYPERDITSNALWFRPEKEGEVYPQKFFKGSANFVELSSRGQEVRGGKICGYENILHHELAYGQGTKTETNLEGHILFYESDDDRPLGHKRIDWKSLLLPEPTVKTFTGNKSLHNYWILNNSIPMERLYEIQLQILRKAKNYGSDGYDWKDWRTSQKNKGLGRIAPKTLRTPGFHHFKTKIRSFAFDFTGKYYDIEDFEKLFPIETRIGEWDKKNQIFLPYKTPEQREAEDIANKDERERAAEEAKRKREERHKQYQLNAESYQPQDINLTGNSFSLLDLIARTSLETFHSNGTPGDNNKPSFLLAYDLFGCEDWARREGINLIDSAEALFVNYGIRVYPNDPGEINGKINAARGKSPIGGDDRVRKKVNYLLGYRSKSTKLKNLTKKTNEKNKTEVKDVAPQPKLTSFPKVTVEGKTENIAKGFDNEKFGDSAEAWKLSTVLSDLNPKAFKKIKEQSVKDESTGEIKTALVCDDLKAAGIIKNWIEQKLNHDANESSGIVGFGRLSTIRYQIAYEKEIFITDSDDTSFEYGLFIPTDGIENGISNNLSKSVILLRKAITEAKEKGFKIKLVVEQKEERVKLLQLLRNQGLLKFTVVVNEHGTERGAGFYIEQLKQNITADIIINQRYLGNLKTILKNSDVYNPKVIFLKSPTGTGKTQAIKILIDENYINGQRTKIIAIYNLEKLTNNLGDRLKLVNYKDTDRFGKLVNYSNQKALNDWDNNGLAITIQSLKDGEGYAAFDPDVWANYDGQVVLFLDEIEATLNTLANSSTVPDKKGVYEVLAATIKAVIQNPKGLIVAADANISQSTIKFLKSCIPDWVETTIIENQYLHQGNRKALVYESKEHLLNELNEDKYKLNYIATDSRKILRKGAIYSSRAIEHMLDGKIFRVDGETAHTVDNPNYPVINNIETLDKQGKINQSLGITPIGAMGISIENTPFDNVYGFFRGICDGETIHQMLERDRRDTVRKIYIEGCRVSFFNPNHFLDKDKMEIEEIFNTDLNIEGLLIAAGESEEAEVAVKQIADEPLPLKRWRQEKAVFHAWQGKLLRVNVIAQMQDRGYEVEIIKSPEEIETKNKITSLVDTMKNYCEQTWEADKIAIAQKHEEIKRLLGVGEESKLIQLEQQQDRTYNQHLAVECWKAHKWLKSNDFTMEASDIEVFTHLKKETELGFFIWTALQDEGNLGYAKAVKRDVEHLLFSSRLKREIRSNEAVRKLLCEDIKFQEFILEVQDRGGVYSLKDDYVRDFNDLLLEYAPQIKSLLKITLSHDKNRALKNIGSLLRKVGYNQKKEKHGTVDKSHNNSGRLRFYSIVPPVPEILRIWKMWLKHEQDTSDVITEGMKEAITKLEALWHQECDPLHSKYTEIMYG